MRVYKFTIVHTFLFHSHCALASCLIYAWALLAHPYICNCRLFGCVLLLKQIYFDNIVPFDNTTLIYLINLLCKLRLGFR